jgi:hypothetical protein
MLHTGRAKCGRVGKSVAFDFPVVNRIQTSTVPMRYSVMRVLAKAIVCNDTVLLLGAFHENKLVSIVCAVYKTAKALQ